jgi:hypothetical protein
MFLHAISLVIEHLLESELSTCTACFSLSMPNACYLSLIWIGSCSLSILLFYRDWSCCIRWAWQGSSLISIISSLMSPLQEDMTAPAKRAVVHPCSGFAKPVVRPVPHGTGPARYTNRSGSHPKPWLNFETSMNRPVWPVYRPVFWTVGTDDPTVLGTLPLLLLSILHRQWLPCIYNHVF